MKLSWDIIFKIFQYLSYKSHCFYVNKIIYKKHRFILHTNANKIKKYYIKYCLKNSMKYRLQKSQIIFIRRYSYYYNDVKKLPNIICIHMRMNLYLLQNLKNLKNRKIYDVIQWLKKNVSLNNLDNIQYLISYSR